MNTEIEQVLKVQTDAIGCSIRRSLDIEPVLLTLKNPEAFLQGSRYLYGFSEFADGRRGFVKATSDPNNKMRLQREVGGLRISAHLGVTGVGVLDGYRETTEGIGVIQLEQMDIEQGAILTTPELIAAGKAIYGAMAAQTILALSGREIPEHVDSSILRRDDERNASAESFWSVWNNRVSVVTDPKFDEIRDGLINRETLIKMVTKTEQDLLPFINISPTEKEYFVHNDAAPSNMFFPENCRPVPGILLDYEYAGATKNRLLALMIDLGNYYGRLWPNPEMQRQYLLALLEAPLKDDRLGQDLETRYKLVRAIAVLGAIFLAKFAMNPEHSEHPMSRSLLGNLSPNLTWLEEEYQGLKKSENS